VDGDRTRIDRFSSLGNPLARRLATTNDEQVNPPSHPRPFIGAFESTYLPGHGVDVADGTDHDRRFEADLDALVAAGVTRVRYALRWHRIEQREGRFDWAGPDAELAALRARGLDPIVDLVHHTSYPEWLDDGFRDRRFAAAYERYAIAAAERYPWIPAYTLFNEPFATLFLAGHEALWPPYDRGMDGFVRLVSNVLPAISKVAAHYRELLPTAQHVWVDTCESHRGTPGRPEAYARLANDRRHVLLDLALGHDLDPERPFLAELIAAGGSDLLDLQPLTVDVLGLDYYSHSEWWYTEGAAHSPSPHPFGFAAVAAQYAARYDLPMMLTETNIRGLPSDRASWLRYTLEQYELAVASGVPLVGYCWFPFVDSVDWDSLLARPAKRVDPVGVLGLGVDGARERTLFTDVWQRAAVGDPVDSLPAYRFQPPCDEQLAGLLPQLAHWPWQDAPDPVPAVPVAADGEIDGGPDLVVVSHLRWTWVWQRPQHLVSRFAARRGRAGGRTWFVEEPMAGDVSVPQLASERRDGVERVWLVVPREPGQPEALGFDAPGAEEYPRLLAEHLRRAGAVDHPDVLLYTPMASDFARELAPARLAYDVMDDLASFHNASPDLRSRQSRVLASADVVFAGGRSLHRSVTRVRSDAHLYPSGVDTAHYAESRRLRRDRASARPVAGYVGVLDERLDLELIAALAAALPDWTVRIVGPVAKIRPESLPQAPNLEYPGMASYDELPAVMADFDVALMPFALNEATRSISPTKTLEYLAAGLPVVSTRVPDVVADYPGVVCLADTAADFARACVEVAKHDVAERDRKVRPHQERLDWNAIAAAMAELIDAAPSRVPEQPHPHPEITPDHRVGLPADLENAHAPAAAAAAAGLQDAALGRHRLTGRAVEQLAHAAVTSATPFVRAPLLARLSVVARLHPPTGDEGGLCPTCGKPAPCATASGVA
jgi:beta-glucosidase/6-phospho-beta-glucosidase/beta-galactosidase/glycosyltransferase involved in cell wall biosynthesis